MKKRLFALVMACTMLFTVPVFAGGLTRDEAKKEMNAAEAGIEGVKQKYAAAFDALADAQGKFDAAAREVEAAKDRVVHYERPNGMTKHDSEKQLDVLKNEVEKAEKYRDFCADKLKDAKDAAKDAIKALEDQFREYEKYKAIYESK